MEIDAYFMVPINGYVIGRVIQKSLDEMKDLEGSGLPVEVEIIATGGPQTKTGDIVQLYEGMHHLDLWFLGQRYVAIKEADIPVVMRNDFKGKEKQE